MIEQVNKETFITRFDEIGRGNTFTVAARKALFEYIEEMESDCGDTINFDPIALCCDWREASSALEYMSDNGCTRERGQSAMEYLSENTQVIEFNLGILVAAF